MRRAVWILGVLVGLLPLAAGASADLEIVDVDVEAHPQISITVSVPAVLAGIDLPADAFTLVENGYAVEAGVWTSEQEPLDVVLVMDTSGSMSGQPLADAREAAAEFVDRLPTGARIGIVSSGAVAEIRHPLDDRREAVSATLASLEASGETALYDAVIASIGMLTDTSPRGAVVVLSDGGDTVSTATLGDVVDVLQASGVETFVIGLQTGETDSAALASMAAVGGGEMISIADADLLGETFLGIAEDLSGRYRLVYRSVQTGRIELVVGVSQGEVSAVARIEIDLPETVAVVVEPTPVESVPVAPSGTVGAAPVAVLPPPLLARPWTMPAGVAAAVLGAVALMVLVMTSGRRTTTFAAQVVRPGRKVALRPGEFVLLSVSVGVAAVAGSLLVVGVPAALAVAALAMALPRVVLRVLTGRRRAAFANQFDGTLQMLSGSLRAGYGLMQSVSTVATEAPSPTGQEFARVSVENQLGRTVEQSLRAMAGRMENEDLGWVVEAIDIQYEVGGDLAEVLDTVAETIRDRDQIRRQVKALSAEGRISAAILVTMPFAIAFLISMVSPEYLAELTGTGIGRVMIGAALVMIGIGAAWIKRIVKVVF